MAKKEDVKIEAFDIHTVSGEIINVKLEFKELDDAINEYVDWVGSFDGRKKIQLKHVTFICPHNCKDVKKHKSGRKC